MTWKALLVDQSRSFNTNSRNDFFDELFHNNTFWLKDRDNILLIIKKMLRQSVINTDDRDASSGNY